MYRKQCERYRNAALEEEFLQKRDEMMEIIKKAEFEAEYGKYKKGIDRSLNPFTHRLGEAIASVHFIPFQYSFGGGNVFPDVVVSPKR